MFPAPSFEKVIDGRYNVLLSEGCHSVRVGLILGGNGKWSGETGDGMSVGFAKTRFGAANKIIRFLMRQSITKLNYIPIRLSFEEYFEENKYREQYERQFKTDARKVFAGTHLPIWLDSYYRTGLNIQLSEKEAHYLGRTMNTYASFEERDILQCLISGEKVGRWVLPVIEGILTTQYWKSVLA